MMRVTFTQERLNALALASPISKLATAAAARLRVKVPGQGHRFLSEAVSDAYVAGFADGALEVQRQLRDEGHELKLISPDGSPVR